MSSPTTTCASCGRAVRAAARFCPACGSPLRPADQGPPVAALGPGGRYRVERALGQGGFGAAFLVRDTSLDRLCVLKRPSLDPALPAAARAAALEAFAREARTLVALNSPGHPNIPEIYDFLPELPALVMKFIAGPTLDQAVEARGGRLPLAEALAHARALADALAYLHARPGGPILHRDVKPANILLDEAGRAWLIDFGLAQAARVAAAALGGPDSPSTVAGTLGFAPPEQWRGQAEPRSDVYALAATLHRVLSGQAPAGDTAALMRGEAPRRPLRELIPGLDGGLARLIERALAPGPVDRPSAAELRDAIDGLALRPSAPPPPEPERPPMPPAFVGRARERAALGASLARDGAALISGAPGVGKSSLAAAIALDYAPAERVVWHSLRPGEGAAPLAWSLAAGLARRGRDSIWAALSAARRAGEPPPPAGQLFDTLLPQLVDQGLLLCVDNAQAAAGDPELARFLERARALARAGQLALVVATREAADLALAPLTLGGLARDETAALLAGRGVSLPGPLLATLHEQTAGNPQLLVFAAEQLRRGADPARLVAGLAESVDVERFLLDEVDRGLSDEERRAMTALAAMLGQPASRQAIAAALDGAELRRPLLDLAARGLIRAEERGGARVFALPALLRELYYDRLGRAERLALHRRVAAHYATEEPDALAAAAHAERAGDDNLAAELAAGEPWVIVGRGQGQQLRGLLDRLSARPLADERRVGVALARGELAAYAGDDRAARAHFEEALAALAALSDSQARSDALARACHGMGAALERESPSAAAHWLRRGIVEAEAAHPLELAALQIKLGTVLVALGDSEEAAVALERGRSLLPPGPSRLRARALHTLGMIHSTAGRLAEGMAVTREAIAMCEQLGDDYRRAMLLANLATDLMYLGDWPQAAAQFDAAGELAAQTGNRALLLAIDHNFGWLATRAGDLVAAESRLAAARSLAEELGARAYAASVLIAQADLALRQGRPEQAFPALDAAEAAAKAGELRAQEPEIGRLRAEAALATNDHAAAERQAEAAAELAEELGLAIEEGAALRALGQAQAAAGQLEAAYEAMQRAIDLLDGVDPYEVARARLALGQALLPADPARGRALLGQAADGFRALGAARDLAAAEAMAAAPPPSPH